MDSQTTASCCCRSKPECCCNQSGLKRDWLKEHTWRRGPSNEFGSLYAIFPFLPRRVSSSPPRRVSLRRSNRKRRLTVETETIERLYTRSRRPSKGKERVIPLPYSYLRRHEPSYETRQGQQYPERGRDHRSERREYYRSRSGSMERRRDSNRGIPSYRGYTVDDRPGPSRIYETIQVQSMPSHRRRHQQRERTYDASHLT